MSAERTTAVDSLIDRLLSTGGYSGSSYWSNYDDKCEAAVELTRFQTITRCAIRILAAVEFDGQAGAAIEAAIRVLGGRV